MTPRPTMPARRWTAEERREVVVEAAIDEFAGAGLAGASTEAIARRAGISHAYLFRLFATKHDLFMATVERSFDRKREVFARAIAARGDTPPLPAMGRAYIALVRDRRELLFQFHAYAACGDPDIRSVVRRKYMELYRYVRRAAGVEADVARLFMATGLLIGVGAAIEDDTLSPDGKWMGRLLRRSGAA